jgi:predicted PurR-regulated permease PerM
MTQPIPPPDPGVPAAIPLPGASRRRQDADPVDRAARLAILGLFALALVVAAVQARYFLVPVTAALIVGMTLGPTVDWLHRWRIRYYLASTFLIVLIGLFLYGLYLTLAVPLDEWARRLPEIWDKLAVHLRAIRAPLDRLDEVSREMEQEAGGDSGQVAVKVEEATMVTTFVKMAPPLVAQFLLFGATLFFFLANRMRLRAGLLLLCPTRETRVRSARIIRDTEYLLSRYVAWISLVNIALGIVTGFAMYLLDMPSPALWGALATIFNFIPYLGPATLMVILVGVGSVTYDVLWYALAPALVFFCINFLEGQIITPAVLGQRLTLNPFVVFLTLGFCLWVWGPVGAFVAVPLLLIGAVVASHLRPLRPGSSIAVVGTTIPRARKRKPARAEPARSPGR